MLLNVESWHFCHRWIIKHNNRRYSLIRPPRIDLPVWGKKSAKFFTQMKGDNKRKQFEFYRQVRWPPSETNCLLRSQKPRISCHLWSVTMTRDLLPRMTQTDFYRSPEFSSVADRRSVHVFVPNVRFLGQIPKDCTVFHRTSWEVQIWTDVPKDVEISTTLSSISHFLSIYQNKWLR